MPKLDTLKFSFPSNNIYLEHYKIDFTYTNVAFTLKGPNILMNEEFICKQFLKDQKCLWIFKGISFTNLDVWCSAKILGPFSNYLFLMWNITTNHYQSTFWLNSKSNKFFFIKVSLFRSASKKSAIQDISSIRTPKWG